MIKGKIDGQSFVLSTPIIVSDTIDYLSAEFEFSEDWQGLDKWAHFAHRSASRSEDISVVYDVKITDGKIDKSEHLNLGAGMWSLYIHGTQMENGTPTVRITTEEDTFAVLECGLLAGEPLPLTPMSAAERILAMIGDLGKLVSVNKTDIVSALNEIALRTGGSGAAGSAGVTYTPSVSEDGVISWTNNGGLPNPEPVNIMGPRGADGKDGANGKDGKDGVNGNDGEDGADGKTPVKGTDYWTAADKAEMVSDVLAALPTWNGGSY